MCLALARETPESGTFCVDGEISTCEAYCASSGLCEEGFCMQTCSVGDHVSCPGSGTMCAGDQCCPPGADGKTFPCPSATPGWSECEKDVKESNCVDRGSNGPTFNEQCKAWRSKGPKPTTCDGTNDTDTA